MDIRETPPPGLSATQGEVVDYIRDLARTLTGMARLHELGLVAHYLELAEDAAWEVDAQRLALKARLQATVDALAGEPVLHGALGETV
jgi:hypothetical protein